MDQSQLKLDVATQAEISVVSTMISAASDWLHVQGISQWRPSARLKQDIRQGVLAGETYVARIGADVVGSVRLQYHDPLFWPEKLDAAGYIHKLVIDRRYSGRGLGLSILTAAERIASSAGAAVARLDTHAKVERILSYYRRAGYKFVGEREMDGWTAALFEKTL